MCFGKRTECSAIEIQLANMGIPREKVVLMKMSSEYADAFIEKDPVRKNWIKAFSEHTKETGMLVGKCSRMWSIIWRNCYVY